MKYIASLKSKQTPLFNTHKKYGGRFVNYFGWDLPLHYGSQIQEHQSVRNHAGIFDVSHMGVIAIEGKDSKKYLSWLLANDIGKLKIPGQAIYSPMLNQNGGIKDDLIIYYPKEDLYFAVVNCATNDKDLQWMHQNINNFCVQIKKQENIAIIAVQGPASINSVCYVLSNMQNQKNITKQIKELKPFSCILNNNFLYGRTGYTGEDGLEIILPAAYATRFWRDLVDTNIQPCGLGARNSLRVEAGFNLYGAEMNELTTPMESNLQDRVDLTQKDRKFCGREAIEKKYNQSTHHLVGLKLIERGSLRQGQTVFLEDGQKGIVTSGVYSPILKQFIALARVPTNASVNNACVKVREKYLDILIGSPIFVRNSNIVFKNNTIKKN